MPGLPVHHQLPEFTQTHIHPVGDAIQPSHPLSFPLLLPPIPPSIRIFSNGNLKVPQGRKEVGVGGGTPPSRCWEGLAIQQLQSPCREQEQASSCARSSTWVRAGSSGPETPENRPGERPGPSGSGGVWAEPIAGPSSGLRAGPGAEKQTGPGRCPLDLLQFARCSFSCGPGRVASVLV